MKYEGKDSMILPKHRGGAMSSLEFLHLFPEDQIRFCHRMGMRHTPARHVRHISKHREFFFSNSNFVFICLNNIQFLYFSFCILAAN